MSPHATDSLPNGLHILTHVSTRGSTCRIMLQVPPPLLHLPHHLPLGPTLFVPGHVRVNDWGVAASSAALIASSVCNVIQETERERESEAGKRDTAEHKVQ